MTVKQRSVIALASLTPSKKNPALEIPRPFSLKAWIQDILFLVKLNKMKFTLRDSLDRFYTHWRPLLEYVDDLPLSEVAPQGRAWVFLGSLVYCCLPAA